MVSVIIPAYNCIKYIERCINSISNQSYWDIEIIVIDDGSTDGTGSLCDKLAMRDSRIIVYHQANQGVSSARNFGLNIARGDWIVFVDADDYVDKQYISKLLNGAVLPNSVVYNNIDSFSHIYNYRHLQFVDNEILDGLLNYKLFNLSAPYSKLFNRHVIHDNNISFPNDICMGEDAIFNLRYLHCVDALIFENNPTYHYNRDGSVLSKKYYQPEREIMCYNVWKTDLFNLLNKYHIGLDDCYRISFQSRFGDVLLRVIQSIYFSNYAYSQKKTLLNELCLEDMQLWCKYYKTNRIGGRIICFFAKYRFWNFILVYGFIEKTIKNMLK